MFGSSGVARLSLLALACSLVTGCVPWPRERPAYADLCETDHKFSVSSPQGEQTIYLRTWLYDHASFWKDERIEQVFFNVPYKTGPGEKPEFYVQVMAYNKDRQRPSRPKSKGAAAIPIIYDSAQAYITFEDGSRLNARPEVYLGGPTYDYPDHRFPRQTPYDINSDEVHRIVPKITNDGDYGSVYVIFNTPKFNPNAKWTINLGTLKVAGQTIAIPPMPLCYIPTKKWIGIEPLMRP